MRTKNESRPLFLLFFLVLASLFVFNSYADEVTIDWKSGTYTGEVSNGVRHGQGTFTFADGSKYVGEFRDHKYHGQGVYTESNGLKYVGEWKNGNPWNGTEYDITATYSSGVRTEK